MTSNERLLLENQKLIMHGLRTLLWAHKINGPASEVQDGMDHTHDALRQETVNMTSNERLVLENQCVTMRAARRLLLGAGDDVRNRVVALDLQGYIERTDKALINDALPKASVQQ